jgi:serine/threonine protein kinase
MPVTFRDWTGRVIDNDFPLIEYLGGSASSATFRTTFSGQSAAIRLFVVEPAAAEARLAEFHAIEKLSHPHLLRALQSGRVDLYDVTLLYLVSEFAEENLAQVLPERPLTAEEAREVLRSSLEALSYLHAEGFVHSSLKPSNIMAIGDRLKLSADSLRRVRESLDRSHDPHDAPEASYSLSHASDIWSLGATVVEVLTQHLPQIQPSNGIPIVPESVPAPFREIAQHCLLRTPELRWSVTDISNKLNPPPAAASPAKASSDFPQPAPSAVSRPASKRPLILLAVIAVVVFAIVMLSRHSDEARKEKGASEIITPSQPKPNPPAVAPNSPPNEVPTAPEPAASAAPKSVTPNVSAPALSDAVQQVMPEVIPQARNSIQGRVRVKLALQVDGFGNVVDASLASPASSKYFARVSEAAARQWKFTPSSESRTIILEFDFRRSGTSVHLSGK